MRKFLIPIVLGVVSAQVGCTSFIRVYEPLHSQNYSTGEFSYAARGGEMQLDVRGNPFSMIPERFANRVVAIVFAAMSLTRPRSIRTGLPFATAPIARRTRCSGNNTHHDWNQENSHRLHPPSE